MITEELTAAPPLDTAAQSGELVLETASLETVSAETPTALPEEDLWQQTLDEFDAADDGAVLEVVEPPAPEEPSTPAPEAPLVPEVPPPEVPLPEVPPSEEPLSAEVLQQSRDAWVQELSTRYSMTEEQELEFEQSPGKVLQKLAANVIADAVDAAVTTVQAMLARQLPQIIDTHSVQKTEVAKNEQDFYSSWGELKRPELNQTVLQVAREFRATNPQASKEDFIKHVGPLAWVRAGLSVEALVAKMAGTTTRPVASPTYSPAGPGSRGPAIPMPRQGQNEFAVLTEEFLND